LKNHSQNRAGGVAQGEGPEFKLQYRKKKKIGEHICEGSPHHHSQAHPLGRGWGWEGLIPRKRKRQPHQGDRSVGCDTHKHTQTSSKEAQVTADCLINHEFKFGVKTSIFVNDVE
jgi:hypothetical protein